VLFGAVFAGLAAGMFLGPTVVPSVSRRRVFALSLVLAGVALLLLALIAAVFGFTGIASDAAWVAQILAFLFVVLFLVSLVFGTLRGGNPPAPPEKMKKKDNKNDA